ncbi:TPA: hypothetical protein MPK85_004973 [Salmonella enterica]|uniref:hypothetical protein n=1 Tax=Salmonella enterica TaxID=28901 RepID=UPI001CC11DAB|nr:hypothetical protein [Salmonella enterica]EJC4647164.1 hypothetical protein [Salmonella enterica]EKQ9927150.1 hypothetical protein [Salmonella enterica subsp. enterica serovar Panama]HCA3884241.1 hypothetical protein [Salmonella enterica]
MSENTARPRPTSDCQPERIRVNMSTDTCEKIKRNKQSKKESNKQSRSGWGGKRAGAGAPFGNNNAVKHGERSSLAFFPLEGAGHLTPLQALRARNLMLCTWIGDIYREHSCMYGDDIGTDKRTSRELILYDGVMGQHTDAIIRMERREVMAKLKEARLCKAIAKQRIREAKVRKKQQG